MMTLHRWRRSTAIAVATVFALTFTGCGNSSAPTTDSEVGTPRPGGTLEYGAQLVAKIDPQRSGQNDQRAISRALVDSLTASDPETGKILPWLAESFEVNSEASEYTFVLRENIAYHDGTPIDAESVKANFDSILALGAQAAEASSYLEGATTFVIDPRTVKVTFARPNVQFLEATSSVVLGLISTESTKLPLDQRETGAFAGSGPFKVESFARNKEAVLVRDENYNHPNPAFENDGPAYLDKIVFHEIPEHGVRSGSLRSGIVSVASHLPTAENKTFVGQNGFRIIERTNPGIVFNFEPYLERDVLHDIRVRQAIQKSIDRAAITKALYGDEGTPAKGVLADTTPLVTDLSTLLERDLDGAKALLDEAGWQIGDDGIRTKDGKRLELSVIFWQEQEPVVIAQQQLRQAGIDLRVRNAPSGEVTGNRDTGNYHFTYYNTSRNEPDRLREAWGRGSDFWKLATASDADLPHKQEIIDLLDEQVGELDQNRRAELIERAQTLIIENGYDFPIYQLSSQIAVADNVQGLKFDAYSRLVFSDVWLTDSK